MESHGPFFVKRDDLFGIGDVRGGKVRTCLALANAAAQKAPLKGLVTAGSRSSPQVNIVATVAQKLGVKFQAHIPQGEPGPEILLAISKGAEIKAHRAGYNSVIVRRAKDHAAALGYTEIPFGMECEEAVTQNRQQVRNLPGHIRRLVVPVGSGMSLCGILWGLIDHGRRDIKVVGVQVGADPVKRLCGYAPLIWPQMVTLVQAGVDYHSRVAAELDGIALDPIYEAKCLKFLEPGDLFWIVGIRESCLVKNIPK